MACIPYENTPHPSPSQSLRLGVDDRRNSLYINGLEYRPGYQSVNKTLKKNALFCRYSHHFSSFSCRNEGFCFLRQHRQLRFNP